MELSYIKDIVLILTGLYSIYYITKNRRNNIREDLYKRQVDLLLDIFKSISGITDDIYYCLKEKELNQQNLSRIKAESAENIISLGDKLDKAELLLPNELYLNLSKFYKLINTARKDVMERNINIEFSELIDKEIDIADEIREFIGTERLSNENRNLIRNRL